MAVASFSLEDISALMAEDLSRDFGWSRATLSLAAALPLLTAGLMAPANGYITLIGLPASTSRSSFPTGIQTSLQLRRMAGAISQSWALI